MIKKLAANRNGATAIEYGLIAGLIAVAIVAVITATGADLTSLFTTVNSNLTTAAA